MREAYDHIALVIVLAWTGFAMAGVVTGPGAASLAGCTVAALVLAMRRSVPVAGAVAFLSPLGVMLPALALRDVAAAWGVPVVSFGTIEIAVFLTAYAAFLASAMGLLPFDLYRFGYAPRPVAAMVLAVCFYGMATGSLFLPLVAFVGQALWVARLGSSNWFDHVLHAMLLPVGLVVLVIRMV